MKRSKKEASSESRYNTKLQCGWRRPLQQVASPLDLNRMSPGARKHPINLSAVFQSFWDHRPLILQMTRREIVGRYRGSIMGLLWSLINPILMLGVYSLVFGKIFQARWGTAPGSAGEFTLVLFAGMIVHGLLAECVNRAPGLIVGNVNYVKKVVFPLEILPWVQLGAALFHATISSLALLVFVILIQHSVNWTLVFVPVVLLPYLMFIMGCSWFLAATGVYLRDLGQITGFITTVLLFLSPVFYPVSALPENYRFLMLLNPLTFIIEQFRNVLIWGNAPDWTGLGLYLAFGVSVAWAGFFWFQKTRRGFADVL